MKTVTELAERIFLIDGFDLKRKERTGSYVIKEEEIVLIETSASPSIPFILAGLSELSISPESISYIILTHIHLDHAGGAGLFLQHCPNAKVIVHAKGAKHLSDPSKLIASAKKVYRNEFDLLFTPIIPIPPEKILIKGSRDFLKLSEKRTLTFYDTPGHATHHLSIHDSVTNGMFSGDTVGIYYQELVSNGLDFFLPSTSPNQFNPDAMLEAILLYEDLGIKEVFFGHYGSSKHPEEVYKQIKYWLPLFISCGKEAFLEVSGFEKRSTLTAQKIYLLVEKELTSNGIKQTHPVYEIIKLDTMVSAMGVIDYLTKLEKA